jgi:hypothetical protein
MPASAKRSENADADERRQAIRVVDRRIVSLGLARVQHLLQRVAVCDD